VNFASQHWLPKFYPANSLYSTIMPSITISAFATASFIDVSGTNPSFTAEFFPIYKTTKYGKYNLNNNLSIAIHKTSFLG